MMSGQVRCRSRKEKGDSHPVHVTSSRGVCSYSWRVCNGTRVSGLNVKQVSPTRDGVGHGGRYTKRRQPPSTCDVVSWGLFVLVEGSRRDGPRVSGLNVKRLSPTRVGVGHVGRYTSNINPFEFGCVLSWWACFLLTTRLANC